jgi:hypothetical protein
VPVVGGSATIASRALRIVSTGGGVAVTAGSTPVTMGAEFGSFGKRSKKRAYVTRSRKGNAYVVRRRTKVQFRPHLGRRGYWFWPAVRKDLKGINRRVGELIREAVNP